MGKRTPGDMFPVAYPDDTAPRWVLGMDLRPAMNEEPWVADKDYYADVNGNLVEPGDPAAQTVVAAKGYTYPRSVAVTYGIVADDAEPAENADAGDEEKRPAPQHGHRAKK